MFAAAFQLEGHLREIAWNPILNRREKWSRLEAVRQVEIEGGGVPSVNN
jgi:hypothetical protein